MNNSWRLLLLAVVALLQPIASFTEGTIDGPQECCDHRSNSIPQDTRLHENYRKASEERRLNREDIRGARRDQRHADPIIRSRVRLALERAKIRTSPEAAIRSTVESRFARDQDLRQRISSDARESREIRNDENRRARENHSRDVLSQNKHDGSDTSRIRASRDETRIARFGIERMLRDSRERQRTLHLEERSVTPNRDTMAVLKRERGDVTRNEVRLGSGNTVFRSESKLQLDNNRERRAMEKRANERRSLSLDSRQVNNEQEMRLSRQASRADRSRISRTASELANERRQRDQHRESRDRTSTTLRDSRERMFDERREFRDTSERANENKRGIRNNERRDERRQQRESLKSRDTLISRLQESSARNAAQRRQVAGDFARYSRTAMVNTPSEIITKSHGIMDERKLSRDRTVETLRISRGTAAEPRQESRVARISQMLETTHVEKQARNNERNSERRQIRDVSFERAKDSRDSRVSRIAEFRGENLARNDKRSDARREFARASVLPESRNSRSADREYNSRDTARLSQDLKRDIRDERTIRIHRDVRSADILDERRQNRGESRLTRDRTFSELRSSRDSVDGIHESRRILRTSQSERSIIFERESRDRANERVNVNHREHEERNANRENSERKSRDTERRNRLVSSRDSPHKERAYSNELVSRNREDIRSNERVEARRDARDEYRDSRDRTVVLQRLNRIAISPQESNDIRRAARIADASNRVERALEDIRDNERREVRRLEMFNKRASRERSINEFTRERITMESRQDRRQTTRDSRNSILNEVSGNREIIRASVRLEGRRHESQSSKERLALQRVTQVTSTERSMARHQDISSRSERNIRNEKAIRNISGRINERSDRSDNRNYRTTAVRRETRWMTDREVKANRYNLVMERMVNHASNDIRTEASIRYDAHIGKDDRIEANTRDTKHAAIVNSFRNIPFNKNHDVASVEEQSENEVFYLNWHMVIYTLQGAYLCGLLMQTMTEKSTTGKPRNFAWWSSTRELLKID